MNWIWMELDSLLGTLSGFAWNKKVESSISFCFLIILFYKMSIANKTPFSLHLFKEQQEKHSTGSDCLDMTGTFFFRMEVENSREKKKRKIERKNKFILHYFMLVKKQLLFNIFFFSLCENTIIIFYFSWY